ncbi:unnamed protein product [Adineta ricciae]|nr:unnamed protein product [Adineta ricciae]
MTQLLRARKDYIDLRPIPIDGSKNYSYRWKMIALLDFNERGQYILPFSKRVVDIPKDLWRRNRKQPAPPGYELCGCIDCEHKTWEDHVLRDDLDDEVSTYGNMHLELVYCPTNDDDENIQHQSCNYSDGLADESVDDYSQSDNSYELTWRELSLSPFPCGDPYDSLRIRFPCNKKEFHDEPVNEDVVIISPDIVELCATKTKTMNEIEVPVEPIALHVDPIISVTMGAFPKLEQQLAILPLFPTGGNKVTSPSFPLLPNIPPYQLSPKELMRRHSNAFEPSFEVIDNNPDVPSLLRAKYQLFYSDLIRRLKVDFAILDYNYTRLDQYIQRLVAEQIQVFNLLPNEISRLDEREYPLALEFFLQFDVNMFYMKTCSFRHARPRSMSEGLFCVQTPEARYELAACGNCGLCYPQYDMTHREKKYIVEFSQAHTHSFVNGYKTILNCSASCHTQNIIYTLTCVCGKMDYIGATSGSLHDRLYSKPYVLHIDTFLIVIIAAAHREHGNRIMHEFLLGQANIMRDLPRGKTNDIKRKDRMQLYKHSTRCLDAMQIFLDANPQYWRFVPMAMDKAVTPEQQTITRPQLFDESDPNCRSKEDCQVCIQAVPRPPDEFTFSNRQILRQAEYFHNKRDKTLPNRDIDLYHATIVAVLPDSCSNMFRDVIESLFITYADTTLNTIGNVLREEQQRNHYYPLNDPWSTRSKNWCNGLVRRPWPTTNPN